MDNEINISWFEEGGIIPSVPRETLEEWIKYTVNDMGYSLGEISYIFVDDEGILDINKQYLDHDYYTDIITFDYTENKLISGDLFISIDTVRSNANKFDVDYLNEFYRVVIHGILHLCGIADKSKEERANMEKHEDKYLSVLSEIFFKNKGE